MTIEPIERYEHHGKDVAVMSAVKGKHRSICLCFQGCKYFKPDTKENCHIAQAVFANCVEFDLVTPVVECPKYEVEF